MEENTWLDYVAALGSVATPILVIALSAIGWRVKAGIERRIELEDQLRQDRIDIYNKILEPFVILLTSDAAWSQDRKNKNKNKEQFAQEKMLSLEYRECGFKMSLVGSDAVVKAYNNLMQYFYAANDNPQATVGHDTTKEMLELLGSFLLEIRRSMGNETTQLDHWDMCEWWMSDARILRDGETVA
ncbi:hypothetical protein [Algiphilus sp.]|uniref:hypothetical protein n=1 Tax=Algiphilus sp. TaxID=1872431 RepID=UPI0032EEB5B8